MENTTSNALNFSYLLLDYYKDLNINEEELAVILMIDHLLDQNNEFITNDLLSLKMSLDTKKIDTIMTILYQKKYIEFINEGGKTKTSIRPLKKILFKMFERSIFTDEELKKNEDNLKLKEELFDLLEDCLSRNLSPIEISRVEEWIKSDISRDILINSIKDAKLRGEKTLQAIDRIIIRKLRTENNVGDKIK